jgi:hypothetical protein
MFKWWKAIFKKKNKCNDCKECTCHYKCETCVYWKSEEANNAPPAEEFSKLFAIFPGQYRMCDVHKEYTHKIHSCALYKEEYFEAKPDSIQSKEIEINQEFVIDRSNKNDVRIEKK